MTATKLPSAPQTELPPPIPDRSIVLIGLMGAGKSSIGKRLAKALELPFVDSDEEIVQAAGCSITNIFEVYGEAMFRDLERRVLQRLLTEEHPKVIATGGGAFLNEQTRALIKEKAVSVWLHADIEVLYERVSRKNNRPLLEKGDKRQILEQLMKDREPFYRQADITVNSNAGAHENVVVQAIEALRPVFPHN